MNSLRSLRDIFTRIPLKLVFQLNDEDFTSVCLFFYTGNLPLK